MKSSGRKEGFPPDTTSCLLQGIQSPNIKTHLIGRQCSVITAVLVTPQPSPRTPSNPACNVAQGPACRFLKVALITEHVRTQTPWITSNKMFAFPICQQPEGTAGFLGFSFQSFPSNSSSSKTRMKSQNRAEVIIPACTTRNRANLHITFWY